MGLVTFWSQMSQMVTLSDVTGTNLFMFTFSRKWFWMKWNPEKHNRVWPLFMFYVWNPDQNYHKSKSTLTVQFSSIFIYFQVRLGPGPLRCPSLTRLPVWEPIPGPLLTNDSCSAVRAQIISLRSDDLVMPKLPACGREWWQRRVSPSAGGDWWATCHVESCARYSTPPFTYRGGVLRGLQLRTLCLETELGKRQRKR